MGVLLIDGAIPGAHSTITRCDEYRLACTHARTGTTARALTRSWCVGHPSREFLHPHKVTLFRGSDVLKLHLQLWQVWEEVPANYHTHVL